MREGSSKLGFLVLFNDKGSAFQNRTMTSLLTDGQHCTEECARARQKAITGLKQSRDILDCMAFGDRAPCFILYSYISVLSQILFTGKKLFAFILGGNTLSLKVHISAGFSRAERLHVMQGTFPSTSHSILGIHRTLL